MARGRMIDRRISKSKKIPRVKTDRARALYFMVYPHLDRDGMIAFDDLEDLKVEILPYFFDYTVGQIAEDLNDLADVGLINVFPYREKIAIKFIRFEDFQSFAYDREAPSEIKEVPDDAGELRITQDNSGAFTIIAPKIKLKSKVNEGMNEGDKKNTAVFRAITGKLSNEINPTDIETAYSACKENDKELLITDIDDEFDQMWKNFPGDSKTKGNKSEALGLYRGLRKKVYAEVIAAGFKGYSDLLMHKKVNENFAQRPMNVARFLRKGNWLVNICFKFQARL